MTFRDLLEVLQGQKVFRPELLARRPTQQELHRWYKDEWIVRLGKGLYCISDEKPLDPLFLANLADPTSYVSGESALAFHGLMKKTPERVWSVTRRRSRTWKVEGHVLVFQRSTYGRYYDYWYTHPSGIRVAWPAMALLDLHQRNSRELDIPKGFLYDEIDLDHVDTVRKGLFSPWQRSVLSRFIVKAEAEICHSRRRYGKARKANW